MRTSDAIVTGILILLGTATGWLTAGLVGAIAVGAATGALASAATRARVRTGVTSAVLVGTLAGGLIGTSVVEAICLPSTCQSIAIAGGVIAASVSFFGIGLVAALVARSFDEHNERTAEGLPPTGVGYETGE